VFNRPKKYISVLEKYDGMLSPDFSLYSDYPLAVQIWNTYRNRWCGAYYQSYGIKVIPTITWSTPESYKFCFLGVEEGSIVAVSSVGVLNKKEAITNFKRGYKEMIKTIHPEHIIFYGTPIEGLKGNITPHQPFHNKFKEE
jgi:hypothetical protein